MAALVEFKKVQKAFGKNRIYDDLTLTVEKGETLTIIGGSGSGKSVLMKMLIGLMSVDHGEIWFDGERIDQLDESGYLKVRRRASMLFQGAALFDSMDVYDNVSYGLREQGERDEDKIKARVAEVLGWVGLSGIESKTPSELSGGMKKRVGLARAIAVGPELLLYDEPTTGLDPINTRRISELIVSLKKRLGVTSLVVTHDMASAFMISDRMAMLLDRRIAAVDTVEQIRRANDPRIRAFVHGMDVSPTVIGTGRRSLDPRPSKDPISKR